MTQCERELRLQYCTPRVKGTGKPFVPPFMAWKKTKRRKRKRKTEESD